MEIEMKKNSLVLYKNGPAIVLSVGDKIEIINSAKKIKKVRDKDVQLLHEGPISDLKSLEAIPEGDVDAARELLDGETATLSELAEYVYENVTPVTMWHAWLLVQRGIYFTGTLDAIVPTSQEHIDGILAKQKQKKDEADAWEAYIQRVRSNKVVEEDMKHINDIQRLAYGMSSNNRTLKEIGMESTPEKAHYLLLKLGIWEDIINPFPMRHGVDVTIPESDVPNLEDETRMDLTHLETFAIDDEKCNDPDDAISIDGDAIWVHIADVSALVKPNSPLDEIAKERQTNHYFPEIVVPMLPNKVTEQLGLGLTETSPALSFKIIVDETGTPECKTITPSFVKVKQISYAEVNEQLTVSPFKEFMAVSERYQKRRKDNNAMEINLPEVKIKAFLENPLNNITPQHNLIIGTSQKTEFDIKISPLPQLQSRDMVANIMLMTGESVAFYLQQNDIPAPYAIQLPPDEHMEPETMSEMFAARRQFKRSEITTIPGAHSGLGVDAYTRVTSPLRRYADLLVHQQLRAFIAGDTLLSEEEISERFLHSTNTALPERQSNRHWTLLYMQQNPDNVYEGIIVDKRDDRGIILIPELAIEIKMRNIGKYKLDDTVKLKLNRINIPEGDLSCRIVRE
jgi:exoribonuclease-2